MFLRTFRRRRPPTESQPSIRLEISWNKNVSISIEEKLKEEVGRWNMMKLRRKCHAQPPQDNHENMVKKLEKEKIVAYTKLHQKKQVSRATKKHDNDMSKD
jgi:hypothetical protein